MDDISLRPRISFVRVYSSFFVWISLNEHTKDSNNILENTSYIFENPNLCKHSSTGMAHARELVPY